MRGEPYICISDFIAKNNSGIEDFVGMFAVSTGFGVKEMCERYVYTYVRIRHVCIETVRPT